MSEASWSIEDVAHTLGGPPTFKCLEKNNEWRFNCPHCEKEHRHGVGVGHRVAHCSDGPFKETGYYLVLNEERKPSSKKP
jgi:hypothetical protein